IALFPIEITLLLFVAGFGVQALAMTAVPSLPGILKDLAYLFAMLGFLTCGWSAYLVLSDIYGEATGNSVWFFIFVVMQAILLCLSMAPFAFCIGFTVASSPTRARTFGPIFVAYDVLKLAICLFLVGIQCVSLL